MKIQRGSSNGQLAGSLRTRWTVALVVVFVVWAAIRSSGDLQTFNRDVNFAMDLAFDNGDACLDIATSIICNSQDGSKRLRCRQNPRSYLRQMAKEATFTKEELEARSMMGKVDALSIGAANAGLCSDVVRNRQTLCTDRPQLDLFDVVSWVKLFSRKESGARVLLAEHVLEHFHPVQVQKIAAAAYMMLEPGGVFRIAVPDGYKPSPSYQKYIRPGGTASGHGQRHMVAWTIDSLTPIFQSTGFRIVPKEYFDDKGVFHTSDEAYEDEARLGKIRRSYRNDKRNKLPKDEIVRSKIGDLLPDTRPGEPRYTSLWFDAVKPKSCSATMTGMLL